ncbi:MAG TPA: glycosyltransferase family 2 protein [Candidatus Saccharimonadales bacterium]|nr:glycosyltransferase family 2 protein [Candidatus Saccharimonadales bacterium]
MLRNKVTRKLGRAGVKAARAIIVKNPRIKNKIRDVVFAQLGVDKVGNLRGSYTRWLANNYPDAVKLYDLKQEAQKFTYKPLISILTPTYNTEIEHLVECIRSVQAQLYENWELCIVDDASPNAEVRAKIKELAAEDERIRYTFSKKNGHISAATNIALGMAKGEFIGLLDHDDVLWPNALHEVVKALNADKKLDFLYSDEEKIHHARQDHQNPFFKPDWNPEFLQCVNYITHFSVLRKAVVEKVGGFRGAYDGAQDWDLFLRVTHATKRIHHIPTVLYSWRMSATSTAASTDAKPYVVEAQKTALEESLAAAGQKGIVVRGEAKDYWTVEYALESDPLISIVIPTKNLYSVVKRCVDSIYKKTTYKNFEIILVDTGSTDGNVLRWYKTLPGNHENLRIVAWPEQPFSYARSCNYGAKQAKGEYLVMLNNDTEVITPNWLQLMLADAQRADVGPVGCLLFYPGGELIQHAGIGVGLGGIAANLLSQVNMVGMQPMQHIYGRTRHEVSAVTAACLMIKKDRYDQVGGFDEEFRVTYNDVDLCLRLGKAGYRSIYNPAVKLYHHESISVGLPTEKAKRDTTEFDAAKELFKQRWGAVIKHDPHLNINISRDNARFEIADRPGE